MARGRKKGEPRPSVSNALMPYEIVQQRFTAALRDAAVKRVEEIKAAHQKYAATVARARRTYYGAAP